MTHGNAGKGAKDGRSQIVVQFETSIRIRACLQACHSRREDARLQPLRPRRGEPQRL